MILYQPPFSPNAIRKNEKRAIASTGFIQDSISDLKKLVYGQILLNQLMADIFLVKKFALNAALYFRMNVYFGGVI